MIALQSLKYKIFEWCLDTFLDKILINFNKIQFTILNSDGSIDPKNLKVGMKISKIKAWSKTDFWEGGNYKIYYTWLDCKIETLLIYDNKSRNTPIHIEWSYRACVKKSEGGNADPNDWGNSMAWVYDPEETNDDHIEFYL